MPEPGSDPDEPRRPHPPRRPPPPRLVEPSNAVLEKCRRLNDYASNSGYLSAFPNCHQSDFGDDVVYGGWMIQAQFGEWRDVQASELCNPRTAEERFRAVNDYAAKHGFGAGFPNGHEALKDGNLVYGTILLKPEAVTFRDIPARVLGDPNSTEERFRAIDTYASENGFSGGFPTCHEANYGDGVVFGAILMKPGCATWADAPSKTISEILAEFQSCFQSMRFEQYQEVCVECAIDTAVGAGMGAPAGPVGVEFGAAAAAMGSSDCRKCVREFIRRAKEAAQRALDEARQARKDAEAIRKYEDNLRESRSHFDKIDKSNDEAERYERWRDTRTA
jgi:hypothetical protein